MQTCSAMLVTMVSAHRFPPEAVSHDWLNRFAVAVNSPNGKCPPLVTGTFGTSLYAYMKYADSDINSPWVNRFSRLYALTPRRSNRVRDFLNTSSLFGGLLCFLVISQSSFRSVRIRSEQEAEWSGISIFHFFHEVQDVLNAWIFLTNRPRIRIRRIPQSRSWGQF